MAEVLPEQQIDVLDHGFVRLDAAMADDLSVVNAARVSFARRRTEMDDSDHGLIRFLMRERHGTPFEHNAFRFHIRTPIFVAREWFRHRVGCLTGDTEVTFVNCDGSTAPHLRKTMDELWRMWNEGERDGHAPPAELRERVRTLRAEGLSERSIARAVGLGRRAVRTCIAGRGDLRDARWRVRSMRVRVLDEEKGTFTTGHIGDVVEKGVQPVYEVALEDGKTITMTANHRVFTREGWATMGEAVGLVGDGEAARTTRECFLMTNGVPVYQDREWMRARRREGLSVTEIAEQAGCSYHTVRKWLGVHELRFTPEERRGRPAWNRGLRGYSTGYRMTERHRSAIRSARSGVKSNFWRGGVTSERASIGRWTREQAARVHEAFEHTCQACGSRGGTLHAHHIVPVWYDPTLARAVSNLITVCDSCHRDLHSAVESELDFARRHAASGFEELPVLPNRKGVKLAAHPVRVVSVTFVGLRQTYDLCMEGPWHNFVANGVVVHNSFNEFSMRYAKATDEFYVPAAEDVRSQVGKPGAYSFEPVADELAAHTREELRKVYDLAYTTYEQLVEAGVARELARAVLPVGAYTEFYWTVNARSLMNFLSLRSAEAAQREIRRYAEACEQLFATAMPVTYEAFVANERRAP